MNQKIDILVDKKEIRLDQFLANKFLQLSRSKIQYLIKNKYILVDGNSTKSSMTLNGGERISGEIIEMKFKELRSENINLDIIYEDDNIIAINKEPGMVVHPGNGNYSGTIANALVYHYNTNLSSINKNRPGIIHRLDKETSGVLLVAKNDFSHYDR